MKGKVYNYSYIHLATYVQKWRQFNTEIYVGYITHATELVLERPGFSWPSYHRLDNSSSHVAD